MLNPIKEHQSWCYWIMPSTIVHTNLPTWQAAIQRLCQLISNDNDDGARSTTSALIEYMQAKQLLDQTIAIIEAAENETNS